MSDFNSINGTKPDNLEYLYLIFPDLAPGISYGKFSIANYPDIKKMEIIKGGNYFDRAVEQLERFKESAKDGDLGSTYDDYLLAKEVYGLLEVYEVINLPGHQMTIPERNAISFYTLYLMNDDSLKVTYLTGDLYYDIEDCKKVAIKGMKDAFEYADQKLEEITKQIENEKKDWEKVFLDYPHLVV